MWKLRLRERGSAYIKTVQRVRDKVSRIRASELRFREDGQEAEGLWSRVNKASARLWRENCRLR